MQSLKQDEIKTIQLEILSFFHKFCEVNNLKYCLYFGTLIGAIRHQGYIPWDDDIDVLMPRNDYEKMLCLFEKNNNSKYKIIDFRLNVDYYLPFAKIVDGSTVLKERVIPSFTFGVYIDIFPLDQLPSSLFRAKIIRLENKILTRLLQLKVYPKLGGRISYRDFIRWLIKPFKIHFFLSLIHKNSTRFMNRNSTKYVSNIVWPTYRNEILESEWFNQMMLKRFESEMRYVPKLYDKVLNSLYGDYMKLPPIEKRINKHHYSAWKQQ